VCVCERGTRRRSAQCPMQQDVTGRGVFLPQVVIRTQADTKGMNITWVIC
jgi:hypothetical protein